VLVADAAELAGSFARATPFPHLVLDDFLDPALARKAARLFPEYETMERRYAGLMEARAIERRLDRTDPTFTAVFQMLHEKAFVAWLEALTGIEGLRPNRSALHLVRSGGYHNVHADENRDPATGLYQRVNLLLYLTEGWQHAWGGALELWNTDMTACEKCIEPLFNRCLIMEVDDVAFHGYSSVRMPEDVTRKSLACWYFSPERGARQRETHHDVAFQLRPRDGPQARVRHYAHRAASWYRNVDQSLRKGIL